MAAKKIKMTVCRESVSHWNIQKGKKYQVLKSYWFNGEGWFVVTALDSNETIKVPDIFFEDVQVVPTTEMAG
jgi:hypothetical protein